MTAAAVMLNRLQEKEIHVSEQVYDLAVVGGGPGGYVAALRGAQLGLKTVIVEKEHLGGICLNWGCIPTKALLRSAEVYRQMKHAGDYGLKVSDIAVDLPAVVKRSRAISTQLQQGVEYLLKKNQVEIVRGTAVVSAPGQLQVSHAGAEETVAAKHIILATGARPLQPAGLEADGQLVWTYKEAMLAEKRPEKLLVVGAGAIGLEFASFYNEIGTQVTVVEALPQVLPSADEEISELLARELRQQGIEIFTSTYLRGMERKDDAVDVTLEEAGEQRTLRYDRVLLAMGVVGNVENLGLENTRVVVERNRVQVNQWLETNEPGIYAIGDLVGVPCLAHKASHEAVICVEKIAGAENVHPLDLRKMPYCTYSHPQVANIGMTEKQAREQGYAIKVGRFPFAANGKAIAMGETGGMIKTIFDARRGELLGAHMIGAEVTELLQGYGIAMNLETTEAELMQTVFAHPTLSEMMHESVLDAFDRALHI